MNLFFYGTLRDQALLDIVLGKPGGDLRISPAQLDGHGVFWAKGQSFPMIAQSDGCLDGLLVENLTDTHIARLNFYEGGFAYDLRDMTVASMGKNVACQVYWPSDSALIAGEEWLLSDWQDKWGDLSRIAANEAMGYFPSWTATELAQRFPMIRARAQTRIQAKKYAPPVDQRAERSLQDVTIENAARAHAGFFAYDILQLRHRKFDGTISDRLTREVFVGTDAAIVLPYDPVTDQLLLVEQWRTGPTGRHDPNPWCLEPVAGLVDPGETPESCAMREAVEEAEVTLTRLEKVAQGYSSPGASTEYFFLYVGLCDLSDKVESHAGLASENEDIRTHILGFERAMELLETGEINVIPTILTLTWLARHRLRLRGAA
ncbi:MAG: NUDIX domain-containing protein [Paracoccaceae bacterium]|jgi:nudix-type nucleoside diphosphatase (YffH/AdpP family)|nr:NUDIX domain-containing protein [Paracoccaceae bacterium]MDP7186868.1 NUDIX domain-containing protein [Paracoccaceae bacterium]